MRKSECGMSQLEGARKCSMTMLADGGKLHVLFGSTRLDVSKTVSACWLSVQDADCSSFIGKPEKMYVSP